MNTESPYFVPTAYQYIIAFEAIQRFWYIDVVAEGDAL
jgi:hypothetical protein